MFALFLGLTKACQYLPEKDPYTCLEPKFLQLLTRGHLQTAWSESQQGLQILSQDCMYLHALKA